MTMASGPLKAAVVETETTYNVPNSLRISNSLAFPSKYLAFLYALQTPRGKRSMYFTYHKYTPFKIF